MELKKAERKQTFFLGCLYGFSGSGKTYSALTIAKGMGTKIGFIDTENGRASYYADEFDFDVIDLKPPFTPERFIEAIEVCEKNKCDVIIIDSISHEWEGTGGCLEISEQKTKSGYDKQGLVKWAEPKMRHRKLMNKILQTNAHLIICSRAKEKYKQVKGENGKDIIINDGFIMSGEKNFSYEMFIRLYMENEMPIVMKCPHQLKEVFDVKGKLTKEHGEKIKKWLDGGKAKMIDVDALKQELFSIAEEGVESLKLYWENLNPKEKKELEQFKNDAKEIAMKKGEEEKEDDIDYLDVDNSNLLDEKKEEPKVINLTPFQSLKKELEENKNLQELEDIYKKKDDIELNETELEILKETYEFCKLEVR